MRDNSVLPVVYRGRLVLPRLAAEVEALAGDQYPATMAQWWEELRLREADAIAAWEVNPTPETEDRALAALERGGTHRDCPLPLLELWVRRHAGATAPEWYPPQGMRDDARRLLSAGRLVPGRRPGTVRWAADPAPPRGAAPGYTARQELECYRCGYIVPVGAPLHISGGGRGSPRRYAHPECAEARRASMAELREVARVLTAGRAEWRTVPLLGPDEWHRLEDAGDVVRSETGWRWAR